MSDDDPTLSPEREREVRRLLADARHTEPIPGDVAARLDRVLAELAGGESLDATPVISLTARRRQRVVSLLVAAAAVVVLGVGLGQVVGTRNSSEDGASAGSDTAGAARELATPQDLAKKGVKGHHAASGSQRMPEAYAAQPRYALDHPVTVHADRFSRDVTRLRDLTAGQLDSTLSSATEDSAGGLADFSLACPAADWGAGTFVPVRYAGDPGVLVFRRAVGDTQVVDLFQCGSAEVVRSITLPAP